MSIKCIHLTDTHYGNSPNTHRVHEKFLSNVARIIEEQKVDVLIHSGDWTSNKQDQFERTLAMHRKYISIPIVAVRGNHDLWDYHKDGYDKWGLEKPGKRMSWPDMDKQHEEWFAKNDIIHLENKDFVKDGVIITGFDGWYGYPAQADLYTNDKNMISRNVFGGDSMEFHSDRARKGFNKVMDLDITDYRAAICVTHFPTFVDHPKWLCHSGDRDYYKPLTAKFDALCMGHSHQIVEQEVDGCKLYNPGADYDVPRFLIFDI